jgi:hypothetical protein
MMGRVGGHVGASTTTSASPPPSPPASTCVPVSTDVVESNGGAASSVAAESLDELHALAVLAAPAVATNVNVTTNGRRIDRSI